MFTVLQWLVAVGFVFLGLLALFDWSRHGGQRRSYLSAAIGLLAIVSVWGRINATTGYRYAHVTTPITIGLFLASGYALLLFRGTFIPLRPRTRVVVAGLAAAIAVFYVAAAAPAGTIRLTAVQSTALLALILIWCVMVGEPVVRFWLAARGRPAVQRARLRLLSAGFAAIIFILVIAGAGGARLYSSVAFKIAVELVALVSIPLIYASFAPPGWLRRVWREPEEAAFRRAVRDLLLFSPDRATLARRALGWVLRIVGADGGAILQGSELLEVKGMEPDLARRLGSGADNVSVTRVERLGDGRDAVIVPLAMEAGPGAIIALSDGLMPVFGSDEMLRLEEFAANISAGLDRVQVTERIAELEKSKSHFLNLASHEMRTPLSVIRGYLSLLEAGSLGPLNARIQTAVSILSGKALEMNLLIEQMLEAGRLEEGRVVLKPEVLDLGKAAAAAVEVVRPLISARHELVLEGAQETITVRADRERLGTILVNLLDNAIKYSPDGGGVRCRLRAVDATALVSVEDRGVGIAGEALSILFTKFGRVPNPQTEHIPGTGLGLYLCRELARQQGGDITVESAPSRGSTFTLALPLAVSQEESPPKSRLPLAALESTA